jgi:hypothetical protein
MEENRDEGSALDTGQMEASGSKGQVSKINKALSKVVTRPISRPKNIR